VPAYRALVSEGEDPDCEVAHNSPHSFSPKRGVNEQPLRHPPMADDRRVIIVSGSGLLPSLANRPECISVRVARGRDSAFEIWLTGSGISGFEFTSGYQATRVMGLPDGEKI
jgi:hypothetical protein